MPTQIKWCFYAFMIFFRNFATYMKDYVYMEKLGGLSEVESEDGTDVGFENS